MPVVAHRILEKRELVARSIKLMKVEAPIIARCALPGQFIVLRIDETGERIPLTIADSDDKEGTVTLIFQEVGTTTMRLGALSVGDSILDIAGPLGNPAEIKKFGRVICVGGGVGTAVLYPEVKALKAVGNHVVSIIGGRTKELVILEDEIRNASDELHIVTDDGSYGKKGLVTDVLKELLPADLVVAIGPVPMMRAVAELTRPPGVKTVVSLNPIMIDGTGMCGGCRVSVGGATKFVCVDGPEFDAHQVDFDLLSSRLKMYGHEEKISIGLHKCRLGGK